MDYRPRSNSWRLAYFLALDYEGVLQVYSEALRFYLSTLSKQEIADYSRDKLRLTFINRSASYMRDYICRAIRTASCESPLWELQDEVLDLPMVWVYRAIELTIYGDERYKDKIIMDLGAEPTPL